MGCAFFLEEWCGYWTMMVGRRKNKNGYVWFNFSVSDMDFLC